MKIEMSATRTGRFYATKELARLRLECRPCGNREAFAGLAEYYPRTTRRAAPGGRY